jgi:Transposase IS116/IS110/IS902 family
MTQRRARKCETPLSVRSYVDLSMRQRARSPDAGRSHRPSAGCTLRIDEGPGHCHCVAQEVAAGFPVGDPMTLTRGAVSGLGRTRPPPAAELGRQHRLRGRCTMHQPDGSTGTGSDAHPARIPPRHHASGRTGVEEPAHLASWARFAPGVKESAGRKKGTGATGHGDRYLARVLGEAAVGTSRTNTFWANATGASPDAAARRKPSSR